LDRPWVRSVRRWGGRNDYEIILVNDASTDRTLKQMQALAVADPRIRVLDNPTNLGFGGAYKRGASVATTTYVMMLPGDDGFPGQSIAEIISHAGDADIIIPIVTNPGARHWFRAFASKGSTTLLNWAFWLDVGYYNGAVLQRNELLRTVEITTNSFAYQAEALVKLIARGQPINIVTYLSRSAPRDAHPLLASRTRSQCGEPFCIYLRW
jgi:dolichol-phosphate mannosyltransferase